ncbi:MAG: hypothetical protein EON91_12230 [Brevundimonas sp.]|uniref:hypothetical protein n=1 Tax=Brevundimonas sp. TaxID=1871086 RepID=UPI0011FA82DA|nr:hypothetical protein [Brevundimonas sp.]RZJ16671.1 MAG: hypothetical protein EON91_12230 [Brevundimonas sp.]
MGSEKPKTDDAADTDGAGDVDALMKAAWDRRQVEPIPSSLIDHVERLITDEPGDADDQTP